MAPVSFDALTPRRSVRSAPSSVPRIPAPLNSDIRRANRVPSTPGAESCGQNQQRHERKLSKYCQDEVVTKREPVVGDAQDAIVVRHYRS